MPRNGVQAMNAKLGSNSEAMRNSTCEANHHVTLRLRDWIGSPWRYNQDRISESEAWRLAEVLDRFELRLRVGRGESLMGLSTNELQDTEAFLTHDGRIKDIVLACPTRD